MLICELALYGLCGKPCLCSSYNLSDFIAIPVYASLRASISIFAGWPWACKIHMCKVGWK